LQPLVSMLDLPIVAMVDCRGCSGQHLPCVPPEADAVILHGVSSEEDAGKLRSMARLLLGKPVLGVVPDMPGLRCMLEDLPLGCTIPDPWVERLARGFLKFADIEALRAVAESRTAPCQDCCVDHGVTCENLFSRRLRVAYAMDDAFGGYFPDTLETLELLGAELFEFSPLRDENLPHGAELVMIGCGFPDQFADRLAANHSLIAALRAHVCAGGRVYSEGGGTAYLSRSMLLGDRQVPGAGILPYDAELISPQSWPQPVERRITHDGWLGGRGTSVRGYLSNRWRLQGVAEPEHCPSTAGRLTQEGDIVFRYNAVGSLIHLHLAALPHVVAGFVGRTLRAIGSGLAHQ
jgi:cobyrinic acid a,c-diamide synthase